MLSLEIRLFLLFLPLPPLCSDLHQLLFKTLLLLTHSFHFLLHLFCYLWNFNLLFFYTLRLRLLLLYLLLLNLRRRFRNHQKAVRTFTLAFMKEFHYFTVSVNDLPLPTVEGLRETQSLLGRIFQEGVNLPMQLGFSFSVSHSSVLCSFVLGCLDNSF